MTIKRYTNHAIRSTLGGVFGAQVGVLYKASQATGGGFKYSTASAICMAEFVKLTMSIGFHIFAPHSTAFRRGIPYTLRTNVEVLKTQGALWCLL